MSDDRATICIKRILKSEGGFVNNPKDPGGPTNRGVTLGTLRSLHIDVDGDGDTDIDDVRNLTEEEAIHVYKTFYWTPIHCDFVPRGVDYFLSDTAVNSGNDRAIKLLQVTLGNGVLVDGQFGPKTVAAVNGVNDVAGFINRLCDNRISFLKRLHNQTTGALLWDTFGKGWKTRVDTVRRLGISDYEGA